MDELQRPVVSMIVVQDFDGVQKILLQNRSKQRDDTPYRGYWELPQGKIAKGESLEQAASRELAEETGLSLSNIVDGTEKPYPEVASRSALSVFHPVVCVIDAIQNHIGIAVVVTAEGEIASTKEASSHGWHTAREVQQLLAQGRVFPLNVPMLKEFLSHQNERPVRWAS